jgi:hypothetical protein
MLVYVRLGKHPHIAALLDVQGQKLFLEKGQCLREISQGNTTPTDEQKSNWITGLAYGMEYIHSKNVLHADLNAANAIICKGPADEECTKWIDPAAQAWTTMNRSFVTTH